VVEHAANSVVSEADISARGCHRARDRASAVKPDIMAPILVGAFVFAADLLRALARLGLVLPRSSLAAFLSRA